MKIQKKLVALSLALLIAISVFTSTAFAMPNTQGDQPVQLYVSANPYEGVDWASYGQYKAAFHTHSTNSDGSNLRSDMIEDHYAKGFSILTMGDHNVTTTTWDMPGYGGSPGSTDPKELGLLSTERRFEIEAGVSRNGNGMINVDYSNEQSSTDHIMTFWSDFNNSAGGSLTAAEKIAETIKIAGELSGISHLNHPGRYLTPSISANSSEANCYAAANNASAITKYVNLFMNESTCVGMEIINKNDNESKADRILWDNILQETMPQGRNVWAFSNDDSHSLNANGYSWNVMLMPELTQGETKKSMETGSFYAVSRVSRLDGINASLPDGSAMPGSGTSSTMYLLDQTTPSITNIVVSGGTITITGADYHVIEWIADGEVIATGAAIDLSDHADNVNSYVRAQLKSDTGIAFTQPFGVESADPELPAELILTTDKNIVRPEEYFNVSISFPKKMESNIIKLDFDFDSDKFDFAGYTPANGATLLVREFGDGFASVMVMVPDYHAESLGKLMLKAKSTIAMSSSAVVSTAVFVERSANGDKVTKESKGSYIQKTNNAGTGGFEVDMIVLSNLIDAFGMTSDHAEWDNYSHFDFNGNNEIDIFDIVTIAKIVK